MREKYEMLKITDLRAIVKGLGVKGYSSMGKEQLIDILVEKEKEDSAAKEAAVKSEAPKKAAPKKDAQRGNAQGQSDRGAAGEKASEKNADKGSEKSAERNNEKSAEAESAEAIRESGVKEVGGVLEVMSDGFGFIRSDNFLPGNNDIYVSPALIKKYGLKTGDILKGMSKPGAPTDKFGALDTLTGLNGKSLEEGLKRYVFEKMTPIFPNERINLEQPGCPISMRVMNLISPLGKGQRGMIVSPPKAGKTTLLKAVAKSVKAYDPKMHLMILLIDERPEEVTDIREAIEGPNVEVVYSTFDETPEHHKRVAEMVIERAKRLVEYKQDVVILLDSITRLTRAYNQIVPSSGRTLSGGLDPAALHMPKKFFGAARNMREGGSLTILATALVDTGSRMDDVVYEEFKGTGNMEMVLDRKLSERRIFPAIDISKSSTRNENLLLSEEETETMSKMRRSFNVLKPEEAIDAVLDLFEKTRNNREFIGMMQKRNIF